jgi:hypothetical protein
LKGLGAHKRAIPYEIFLLDNSSSYKIISKFSGKTISSISSSDKKESEI